MKQKDVHMKQKERRGHRGTLVPLLGSPKKLKNYYIKYSYLFNTIKATRMQTNNKETDNKQNNICIIAATLDKTNIELDKPDSDSDSDSDSNEQTLLNESFMRTQCSEDNESELDLDTNTNTNINYTCTMCSLVLKINTSFCNASCEQKYLNHKE